MRYHSKTQAPREAEGREEKDEAIWESKYPERDIREYTEEIICKNYKK